MENSFDEIDSFDNVRPPDETKREQLMEDSRSDFDKQLDEALYLSILEIKQQEEINKQYEDQVINEYISETNNRREKFREFLFDLNKLLKYDKDIKEIYEIIEPIIDAYCGQYIEYYEADDITYDKIFRILGTIRTKKNFIELLKNIIIKS
jgi:hypothetical protein